MTVFAYVFAFVMVVFFILGMTTVGIIWTVRTLKGGEAKGAAVDDEETRIIQEIHAGLARMEERIEALETILLEPESQKETSQPRNSSIPRPGGPSGPK